MQADRHAPPEPPATLAAADFAEDARAGANRRVVAAPTLRETAGGGAPLPPLTPAPAEALAALRRLVEKIDVDLPHVPQRIVLVTGVHRGAGASSVAGWLLSLLAATHQGDVLYVDAATRSSAPAEPREGPAGEAQMVPVRRSQSPRVFALDPATLGRRVDPHELAALLGELRQRFAWVVIDAAPPAASPLSLLLGQKADAVVLVVEAERTEREAMRQAAELIRGHGGRLVGALLNKRRR